jgi:hypothetical protein
MPIVKATGSIPSARDCVLNLPPISLHEPWAGITAIENKLLLQWGVQTFREFHIT